MGAHFLSCSVSLNPVILWEVGNYTLLRKGGEGGATKLNIDAVSRKPGVREDIDRLMPETNLSKHKRDKKLTKASSSWGQSLRPGTMGPFSSRRPLPAETHLV